MNRPRTVRVNRVRRPPPGPQLIPRQPLRNQRTCCFAIIGVFIILFVGILVASITLLVANNANESDDQPLGPGPRPITDPSSTTTTRRPGPTDPPAVDEMCREQRTTTVCFSSACQGRYRTYDGTCNNELYPLWGASEIPFSRFLPSLYEDGVNQPIGWDPERIYNGFPLPNARRVSQEIITTESTSQSSMYSGLLMMYGQYLTTDIDHIPKQDSLCTERCTKSPPYCFPIFAPENDPRLATGECIALTRSFRVCNLEPRQQLNSITSFIDAGTVYGSVEDRALGRRDLTNGYGYLKEGVSVNANGVQSKPLLPFNVDFPNGCGRPRDDTSGIPCFFSGDVRANENLGLASLHTVWNREHNRIADDLRGINPLWNGETLYQEARKIVGALHQKVAMEDYLPKIVGSKGMELLGSYNGYSPITQASTSNMFATAAFRFGHAQIPKTVFRLGPDFREAVPYGNLDLHETAFTPAKLVNEGSIDPILRGLFGTPLKEINAQELLSEELTENLFKLAKDIGLDLASLNIQRGREHGLPGYNDWRRFCNLPAASSFDDLSGVISDPGLRRKLQDLYGHPGNMDLWVAGLVEDPWYDSLVGPTFTCLIVEQFKRLRNGDRYWYENPDQFTSEQLAELKKQTLARVFCDSGDNIQHVQTDVFERATYPQDYETCGEIPSMDLKVAWKDISGDPRCPNFEPTPPSDEEVCLTPRTSYNCAANTCPNVYRTYDGTCTNAYLPLSGASQIPFRRVLPPAYEDGINTPRGWEKFRTYNSYPLPNPRAVSHEIIALTDKGSLSEHFSDLMMVYGQYLTTDIDHIPKTNSLCTQACVQGPPYCFPILAPENDPRLETGECIPLTRSTRVCGLEPRQQLNSITSYIDAGVKYGNTEDRALALRDLTNESGHLREGASVNAYGAVSKPLLPFAVPDFSQGCNRPRTDDSGIPCFFSGDVRANENLGLAALHTLWNREHNRIADVLKSVNHLWNGETLYQEARKIVGALHQKIAMEDWLPKTIGAKGMELLGPYSGYNPNIDVSTSNVFATAAFRFGHAQIPKTVFRLGPDFREAPYGNLNLHETAFCPSKFVNEGGIDSVVRGMFGTPLKEITPQELLSDELTENLFALTRDVALDLASLNIQRGREHGLPGYNEWRAFCNLPVANTFDDLSNEISDADLRRRLQVLYGHPGNMDLWVAGLVEDPWYDSLVGPTFTCLIVEQFRRLRDGDRFWYENPGVFTATQLRELPKHSLARVICDSGDNIQLVQPDVFKRATYPFGYITCDQIPSMGLALAWKDISGRRDCPVFANIPIPPPVTPLPPLPTDEVCLTPRTTAICTQDTCQQKYRTYDGTCNNIDYPLWGASQIPFKRLIQSIYEDGVDTPVGWDSLKTYYGYRLPNPRSVTTKVLSTEMTSQSSIYSGLLMMYGQYLTTDMDHIPKTNSLCTEACTVSSPYCFPILAPENDPRLATGDCIALTRSTRVCNLEPRQQLNSITSYIDAGTVYGSVEDRALARRDLTNEYGHLKEGVTVNANGVQSKPLLPYNVDFPNGCNRPRDDTSGIPCFFSGDIRANENLGLAALHTIWSRDHNRIADELRRINPLWNGETLYQEARKIVAALHQKVAIEDYLPKIIGSKGIELLGRYNGYNPRTDVSTSNSFATATFRFGHAQIPDTVFRLGPDFTETPYGNLPLHETAFSPSRLVNEGSIDPILRGLFGTPLKDIKGQELLSDELTERLFALTRDVALDLSTINIQRGRDHGLPLYNAWRNFCNMPAVYSFDDLAGVISDPGLRGKLKDLYGTPGNMDLWVAGLVEDPWYDSLVGPTFTCLIVQQFRGLRNGDRFWYENSGVFTPAQLLELKKHSLARVICDSSDNIQHVQEDVFERAVYPVDYKTCDQIPGMDLNYAWKDVGGGRDCPVFSNNPIPPPPPTEPPVEVCLTPRSNAVCTLNNCELKYRTYDGTCNNQRFPLWGASQIPFKRLLQPIYEDGVNIPVGWDSSKSYFGYRLPNPRNVTTKILTTEMLSQSSIYSGMMMMYGQYLTTDMDHIPKTNSLCTEACTVSSPYCFPILAPENDPRLATGDCIALTRSTRVCDLEPRRQLNSITSYIDAGTIYGSVDDRASARRDLTDESGHLKKGVTVNTYGGPSKPLLPFNIDFPNGCNRPRTDTSNIPCFFSGDIRANENLGLASLHTIWSRDHNRIADELKRINPLWNGETLFQEARKIVGALHQKVAMEDWLPKTIGSKGIELLGPYLGYNRYTDVSTSNSFATATFRFGHAQIPDTVFRLGSDFMEAPYGHLKLHETAFCPAKIVNEGGIDPILRGLFGTPLKDINAQELLSDELTERLFALTRDVALDLSTINIQRGRDHGLPGYNAWRSFCNLPAVYTFDELAGIISDANVRRKLQDLYGHPGNMDLWVAGLVEDPWYDSLVGPTFTCLIAEHFKRMRNGDRFWYENSGVFTPAQLQEIKKHTLARVICDSADHISEVQYDVFQRAFYPADYQNCRDIPAMSLSPWLDTSGGSGGCT